MLVSCERAAGHGPFAQGLTIHQSSPAAIPWLSSWIGNEVCSTCRKLPAKSVAGGSASSPATVWAVIETGTDNIILEGVDNLLFPAALTLIVAGFWWLIKTVTAYTVAHSITLALTSLGLHERSMFVRVVVDVPTEEMILGDLHDAGLQLHPGSELPHLVRKTRRLLDELGDRRRVAETFRPLVEVRPHA
ncbi:MAG: hypothetical protein E4H03_09005, partial [Myxococcales bacterium]